MKKILAVCVLALAGCASLGKEGPLAATKETLRFAIIPDEPAGPAVVVRVGQNGKADEFSSQECEMVVINQEADRREVCFLPLDPSQPFIKKSWWVENALYERLEPHFKCSLLYLVEDSLYEKLSQ